MMRVKITLAQREEAGEEGGIMRGGKVGGDKVGGDKVGGGKDEELSPTLGVGAD